MAVQKKKAKKPAAKKASAGKAKKTQAKKVSAKKPAAKKASAGKTVKAPAKKATAKSAPVKKASAGKVKKATAKKPPSSKAPQTNVKEKADLNELKTKQTSTAVSAPKVETPVESKASPSTPQEQTAKPAQTAPKKKISKASAGSSADDSKKWQALWEENKEEKPVPYNMKKSFESVFYIDHKQFGLGFIMSQYDNRLQVLFKEGAKVLISNYQGK